MKLPKPVQGAPVYLYRELPSVPSGSVLQTYGAVSEQELDAVSPGLQALIFV